MSVIYYLGAPYTSPDPAVMQQRADEIDTFLSHALLAGADVFSPITYGHLMCLRFDLPRSWDFWKRFDLEMLRRSDALLVLQLPGWAASVGLGAEIKHAQEMQKPIEYIDPSEVDQWKPWSAERLTRSDYTMGRCSACGVLTSHSIGALYLCWNCVRKRRELKKGGTDEQG